MTALILSALLLTANPAPDVPALIHDAALRHGVSPAVAQCVAWRESSYRPWVTSPWGHRGLYQFHVPTWREQAPRYGYPADPALAYDPYVSTDLALRMMADGHGWRWSTWRRCGGWW